MGEGNAVNKEVGILMTSLLMHFTLLQIWHSNNDLASFAVWHPMVFLSKNGGGQNKRRLYLTPLPTCR